VTTLTARRCLLACMVALLIPLVAIVNSGCGSSAKAATLASPQAKTAAPATLDVSGSLLVVRRQDAAWQLVRLAPATGAEQVLGALPFKPRLALASPSRARVLYVGERGRLAVVEVSSGAVRRISLTGLPIRGIDGATWTSEYRFLFGGSRIAYPSPEHSALYRADVRTGSVSSFRRLAGSEPSYASEQGSLIYVTRRVIGDTAKEAIWRLRSLTARRPVVLQRDAGYFDGGRLFNRPLISPDGAYVLTAQTGTDVSVTYSLINVNHPYMAMWQLSGGSPMTAAWGGTKVAFQQSLPSAPGAKLAVFVYDAVSCSLIPFSPGAFFGPLDWSAEGDLVGGAWQQDSVDGAVYAAAASDLGSWIKLGAGLVPVWIQ
jgi:hypothetical protein